MIIMFFITCECCYPCFTCIYFSGMNKGPVTLGNLKEIASLCAKGIAEEQSKEQI